MAANVLRKGIELAPQIIQGVEYAAEVGKNHFERIDKLRAVDEAIASKKQEIAELEAWHKGRNIALPKQGGDLMETIKKGIDTLSQKWFEYKDAKKRSELARLEIWRNILQKSKSANEKVGKGPRGKMVMRGGAVMVDIGGSEGGAIDPRAMKVLSFMTPAGLVRNAYLAVSDKIAADRKAAARAQNGGRKRGGASGSSSDGMDGSRSNPNYMANMR